MNTHALDVPGTGRVDLTVDDSGASGRPVLLLHGGAGPASVRPFAGHLERTRGRRVLTPTHPGFDGTARPEGLRTVADLARTHVALLDALGLDDVLVVGNSVGGWVAAEIGLLAHPRVSGLAIVDAVGLALDDAPIADFFSLTMDEVVDLSYHDPDAHRIDPDALPEPARAVVAANRAALELYGGRAMSDPTLLGRLPAVTLPTEVVWGAADRIVPPAHGHAYADAVPGGRLTILDGAGHLPQIETPDALAALL